jgi:hypothetical protein
MAMREVEATVRESLRGIPLEFEVDAGIRAACSVAALQTIVVNLLLAARDAVPAIDHARVNVFLDVVSQSRASGLAGATAGSYLVAQVRAWAKRGPRARSFAGLKGCRLAVAKVGGFLVVEPLVAGGVTLSAYLPGCASEERGARDADRRSAVVRHPDAITRRTIIAALARMGFDCQDAIGRDELRPGTFLFGDRASLDELAPGDDVRAIELVQRGQAGRTRYPVLAVPFEVGDLDSLVG